MRKFLLFLSAAVAVSAVADAAPKRQGRFEARHAAKEARKAKKVAESYKWVPGKVEMYSYDGQWYLNNSTEYTYSEDGLALTVVSGDSKIVNEYTEDGQISTTETFYLVDDNYVPTGKEVYKYDPVVKDFVIEVMSYAYDSETKQYKEQWGSYTVVTRDAAGNVTRVQDGWYNPENGEVEIDDKDYFTVEYKDGKATKITNYDEGEICDEIYDIVWAETNGQILINDYDDEDFFTGANRILSAKVKSEDTNMEEMTLTVEYPAQAGSYTSLLMMGETKVSEVKHTVLDSYGSYTEESYELDFDYDDNLGIEVPDEVYTGRELEKYDSYGLMLRRESVDYDEEGNVDWQNLEVGTVVYDETYGYPTEYTVQTTYLSLDEADLSNQYRQVFSNYVKVSGVADVIVNDADAPVEYFNLQGIRVAEPTSGLYIRRQGSKSEKVLIR